MFKKARKLSLKTLTKAMVIAAVLGGNTFAYAAVDSNALPTGANIKSGIEGDIQIINPQKSSDRAVMNIKQKADADVARIDWNTFNIGSNATLNVRQFNTNQTLVNTVVGNVMSEIYGNINATGNVVLINPKGAIFGENAQINVGGISVYAASGTADGMSFTADPNQKLQGKITVEGNAQINVGPGYALYAKDQMKNLGIDNFEIVMGTPSVDSNVGKLRLVAAGYVELKKGTDGSAPRLVAIGHLADDGTQVIGEEAFIVGGQGSGSGNAIVVRADVDADDF
ncbi:MAG: filamentous hemagglutinin N-terminal domain-containing protein, partial [Bacteroidaceae bacterium]|nr:filamentous hemagglutinin N-terminal domain-containing protein [Bacteroidaceae bacterium]